MRFNELATSFIQREKYQKPHENGYKRGAPIVLREIIDLEKWRVLYIYGEIKGLNCALAIRTTHFIYQPDIGICLQYGEFPHLCNSMVIHVR